MQKGNKALSIQTEEQMTQISCLKAGYVLIMSSIMLSDIIHDNRQSLPSIPKTMISYQITSSYLMKAWFIEMAIALMTGIAVGTLRRAQE